MEKVYHEINRLAAMLEYLDPGPEYDEMVRRIKSLLELETHSNKNVSVMEKILNNGPLLNLIGGLAGTLLILNYERLGIVTSRAFSFIKFK